MDVSFFLPGRTRQLVEISSMNGCLEVPDDRLPNTLKFRTDGAAQLEQRRRNMGRSMIRQFELNRVLDRQYRGPINWQASRVTNGLNLRAAPSTSAEILTTNPPPAPFSIISAARGPTRARRMATLGSTQPRKKICI